MTKRARGVSTVVAAAPEATDRSASVDHPDARTPRPGDWVIAAALLAVFVWGYVTAQDWQFRAALFPEMVTIAGAVLAVLKLATLGAQTVRARRVRRGAAAPDGSAHLPVPPQSSSPESHSVRAAAVDTEREGAQVTSDVGDRPADLQIVDDEEEEDASLEYVFASAGGRAWAAALTWVTAFFVSFFVLGAYLTVPLFAFVYLMVSGRAKWWAALTYGVVAGVLIVVVFRDVVYIPLPEGPLASLGFWR